MTMPSFCSRLRLRTRSRMSARPSVTRCAFHSPGSHSKRSCRAAPARRSSSSRHTCRCQARIAAAVAELERLGIPTGYQTLLVAGGLSRRAGNEQLETLVSPEFARRFHGHVEVHDVERDDLVQLGAVGGIPLRVHPALVRTDAVVVVSAAAAVLPGG